MEWQADIGTAVQVEVVLALALAAIAREEGSHGSDK
jgi:hypothetical protein